MSARMLLRGGLVADGIGATTQRADVLIDGQAIAAITADGASVGDCEVVDLAPGSVICPGFIDAHVHAEGPLLAAGRVDGALDEVTEIARPLAEAQRPYVSHLRGGYGSDVKAGLDELLAVGRSAGIGVHASHLWGAPADIQAAFRVADDAGVTITFDMYPYRRFSTILASLLLPADVQARGPQHTLAALTNPRQRTAILAGE